MNISILKDGSRAVITLSGKLDEKRSRFQNELDNLLISIESPIIDEAKIVSVVSSETDPVRLNGSAPKVLAYLKRFLPPLVEVEIKVPELMPLGQKFFTPKETERIKVQRT